VSYPEGHSVQGIVGERWQGPDSPYEEVTIALYPLAIENIVYAGISTASSAWASGLTGRGIRT